MAIQFSSNATGGLSGKKYKSTASFMGSYIHPKIEDKIAINVDKDIEDAEFLQGVLSEVKKYILNPNDDSFLHKELVKLIVENLPKDISGRQFFNYRGLNNAVKGAVFEEDIANIFSTILNLNNAQSKYLASNLIQGEAHAYSSNYFTQDEIIELLNDLKGKIKQDIQRIFVLAKEEMERRGTKEPLFRVSSRQGKIDVQVPRIEIKAVSNEKLTKLLNILSESTFTLKNYKNIAKVHLGKTDLYKVYNSVLSFVAPEMDDASKIKVFKAVTSSHTKDVVKLEHNFHIKVFYELTGPGLIDKDTGQRLDTCRFLIYNNPDGEDIKVLSTKGIIQKLFKESRRSYGDLRSSISISLEKY